MSVRALACAASACVCAVTIVEAVRPADARAQGASGEAAPAPSSASSGDLATMTITPAQATLTLGVDTSTMLVVTITGPQAAGAAPGRTRATVGAVGPLVPLSSPGSFTAEYRVPGNRIPQSAIVSVEVSLPDGSRVHATTRLMLPAATAFPLRTSPYASVSLEIDGRTFGPRRADVQGNVSIPIVVPPHVARGRARAVNRYGIGKETDVNLQPQDYPRVLLIAPPEGEAGSTIDLEVWAVEPSGDPSPPEDIDLRASGGTIRRVGGMPGLARFSFRLPDHVGAGAIALIAAMDDGASVTSDAMIVRAGPLAIIEITSDVSHLVVGTAAAAHLWFAAQDQFGNAVSSQGMTARADGLSLPLRLNAGGASAEVAAPARWSGREQVDIEATLGAVRAGSRVPLSGGAPARAQLTVRDGRVNGADRNGIELVVEVFDARGTPTSARQLTWRSEGGGGSIDPLPAPRFGAYAARFAPTRTLRDRAAVVAVKVDANLEARTRVRVEGGSSATAAARVGVVSNLGGSFGQAAFFEATVPLRRLGRLGHLLSAGVAIGYLHGEVTTSPGLLFPAAVHLTINQAPLLALGRLRLPGELPVEFSLSGTAGVTFASTEVTPLGDSPYGSSHGAARALVLGAGADASVVLQPGELVIGARYLHADLGRDSNGDKVDGNSLGLLCDLGFRMGF